MASDDNQPQGPGGVRSTAFGDSGAAGKTGRRAAGWRDRGCADGGRGRGGDIHRDRFRSAEQGSGPGELHGIGDGERGQRLPAAEHSALPRHDDAQPVIGASQAKITIPTLTDNETEPQETISVALERAFTAIGTVDVDTTPATVTIVEPAAAASQHRGSEIAHLHPGQDRKRALFTTNCRRASRWATLQPMKRSRGAAFGAGFGAGGELPAGFIVTVAGAVRSNVSVSWKTTDGTAVAGADYTAVEPFAHHLREGEPMAAGVLGDDGADQLQFLLAEQPSAVAHRLRRHGCRPPWRARRAARAPRGGSRAGTAGSPQAPDRRRPHRRADTRSAN